jgi:hypothetical protein
MISSSSPGGILQAQPPPCAYWVSRKAPGSVMRSNLVPCPGTPRHRAGLRRRDGGRCRGAGNVGPGRVVHTNLGRAPLSAAAREAVLATAGYTDVAFDLASGRRGRRGAYGGSANPSCTEGPGFVAHL